MPLTTLEKHVLEGHRRGDAPPSGPPTDLESWLAFALHAGLHAASSIRAFRAGSAPTLLKEDGSPYTRLERSIETTLRSDLERFAPDARLVGEETGGGAVLDGLVLALDPVDGTWAFLTQTGTYATTLAVFDDGSPFLAVVVNPATGELGYAMSEGTSRLLRLRLFEEADEGFDLPEAVEPSEKLLINFHPSRSGGSVDRVLRESWRRGDVTMVRGPGGSPAWALLESARGHFIYANLWGRRSAEAWDLAAGCLLVRRAGGDVVDLDGEPIGAVGHRGPFVAGIDASARDQVRELLEAADAAGD
jgi:fructose-1,6-bisphosphatase/inositol monophosphatase family enzyme